MGPEEGQVGPKEGQGEHKEGAEGPKGDGLGSRGNDVEIIRSEKSQSMEEVPRDLPPLIKIDLSPPVSPPRNPSYFPPRILDPPPVQSTASETRYLLCVLCGVSLKEVFLREHLLLKHRVNNFALPATICAACKKSIPLISLASHYALVHNTPFTQEHHPHPLAYSTPTSRIVTRAPSATPTHACTQCTSSFTTPRGLAAHTRVHDGPYMCVCQSLFLHQGQLRIHRAKHLEKYSCKTCGKSFMFALTLQKHNERMCAPTCMICKKVYARFATLSVHVRKSHKPFRHCHICGLGYNAGVTHACQ